MNQLEKVLGLKSRGPAAQQEQEEAPQPVPVPQAAPFRPPISSTSVPAIPSRPPLQRPPSSSYSPAGHVPGPMGPRPPFTGYARPPFGPNTGYPPVQSGYPPYGANYPAAAPMAPPPRFVPPRHPHLEPVPFKKVKTEFMY